MKKVYIILGILLIPVLLNFLLRIDLFPVIQKDSTPALWLTFWGSYVGAILSCGIAYYVLYKNRKDQFFSLAYQLEKEEIDKTMNSAINYIQIYNENNLKMIYNKWKRTNDKVSCQENIRELMDFSFVNFTSFTIRYPKQRLNTDPFFISQQINYVRLCNLLWDLQLLFSLDSSLWNRPLDIMGKSKDFKPSEIFTAILNSSHENVSVFDLLLESYGIGLKKVESEVRTFLEHERKNLEDKFENAKK